MQEIAYGAVLCLLAPYEVRAALAKKLFSGYREKIWKETCPPLLILREIMMNNRIRCFILLTLLSFSSSAAESGCASLKSPTSKTVSTAQMQTLFTNIIAACNSKKPTRYFALQNTLLRQKLMDPLSAEMKYELFYQYCGFANIANRSIGGRAENGVHTIKQDDNKVSECGNKISYWNIHTSGGELVYKLKVVLENNELKINDH